MDYRECVHPVVDSPLHGVPSAETPTADRPLANHLNSSTGKSRCCLLPVTPKGKTYTLLFTNRFSGWADMIPVTAAEFTAEDTVNILVNQYIPLWGCPRTLLSDNGLQFCSKLSQATYHLLGARKLATSSYHPNRNAGVERVNHTIAQTLAMVVNERQNDWNLHLPHSEFAYKIPSARRRVWCPTRSPWGDSHGFSGRVSTALASWKSRVWPVTTWPMATWPSTDKSARTTLSAHTAPSPFFVLTAELRPRRRAASST